MTSFTDGLRALADLLDEHDAVSTYDDHRHSIFVQSIDELTDMTWRLGGLWETDKPGGEYLGMTRDLGGGVSVYVFGRRSVIAPNRLAGAEA